MGQLVGVLPLAGEGLEIELPFQIQLARLEPGLPHQGQQQGQQGVGIVGGAFEPHHQGILVGFGSKAGPGAFHGVGESVGIEGSAAAGHHPGQQLVGAAAAGRIGAAAAADHQPGRQDRRAGPPPQQHRQTAGHGEVWPVAGGVPGVAAAAVQGGAHAGTASSTKARAGSRLASTLCWSSTGVQLARASSGSSREPWRPHRWPLPIRPATLPAASMPKR